MQKWQKGRIRLPAFFIITVLFVLLFGIRGTFVQAAPKFSDDEVRSSLQFGYGDDRLIAGKWMPVTVTLENKTDKTIEGDVCLVFSVPDYSSGLSGTQETYRMPVILSPQVSKDVVFYVNLKNASSCTLQILDQKRVLYEKKAVTVTMVVGDVYASAPPLLIGVLTDERDSVNYLKKIETLQYSEDYCGRKACFVLIPPERFPEEKSVMASFDLLLINDFDLSVSSALTDRQKEVLETYIRTGGTVFAGTGADVSRVVRDFSDYFASPSAATVTQQGKVDLEIQNTVIEQLYTVQLQDNELETLMERQLYGHRTYSLYFLSWSLSDSVFRSWSEAPEAVFLFLSRYSSVFHLSADSWNGSYFSALKAMPENRMPGLAAIVVILVCYLLLIGPVGYLILKKKKKREWLWWTIPVCAILFAAAVFVYGFYSRGGGTITNTLTMVELNDGSEEQRPARSWTTVMSSKPGMLEFDLGQKAFFNNMSSGWYAETQSARPSTFLQGSQSLAITENVPLWGFADIQAEIEVASAGRLEMTASRNGQNEMEVKVKNNTSYDLNNLAVCYGFQSGWIASLPRHSEETVVLQPASIPHDSGADAAQAVYQLFYRQHGFRFDEVYYDLMGYYYGKDLLVAHPEERMKAKLLFSAMRELTATQPNSVCIAGFADDAVNPTVRVNGSSPKKQNHHTIVYQVDETDQMPYPEAVLYDLPVAIVMDQNTSYGYDPSYGVPSLPVTFSASSWCLFELAIPRQLFNQNVPIQLHLPTSDASNLRFELQDYKGLQKRELEIREGELLLQKGDYAPFVSGTARSMLFETLAYQYGGYPGLDSRLEGFYRDCVYVYVLVSYTGPETKSTALDSFRYDLLSKSAGAEG